MSFLLPLDLNIMNVLLVNPVIRPSEKPAFFPLGLGYITQVLLDDGHNVKILDINATRPPKEDVIKALKMYKPDIIGVTGFITEYKYITWLIGEIKGIHPSVPLIIGGGLAQVATELLFEKTGVDIAVIGEGEITMKELVRVIGNKGSLDTVDGIWYRENNIVHKNKERKIIESLDEITFPNRELFSFETYIKNMSERGTFKNSNLRVTDIITSRGCPYRCSYCYHKMWGHKYRIRSADNIIEEIRFLVKNYNISGIVFEDDTFILDKKRMYKFCELLRNEKFKITWRCNARVDLVTQDLLREMKLAGCEVIAYGIESGSQEILDEIHKDVTVQQAKDAIKWTKEAGIKPIGYIMIGLFSETKETVEETVKFCKGMKLGLAGINYATPIPGTPLYEKAIERGKIKITLEELLEKWDMWQDNIMINLSNIPDTELMQLKKYEERKLYSVRFKNICDYYNKYGLIKLMKRAIGV